MGADRRKQKMENPWPPERIKALRRAFGETQVEFARRLGIHPGSLGFWEQGTAPSSMAQAFLKLIEDTVDKKDLARARIEVEEEAIEEARAEAREEKKLSKAK